MRVPGAPCALHVKLAFTQLDAPGPPPSTWMRLWLWQPARRSCAIRRPPKYIRGGGSLPILTIMQEHLHPDALLTGFGLPEDGEHAPNESLALGQFFRGIDMMVHYFDVYRELSP